MPESAERKIVKNVVLRLNCREGTNPIYCIVEAPEETETPTQGVKPVGLSTYEIMNDVSDPGLAT